MTIVCLVRHGSTPQLDRVLSGRADTALDRDGLAQADHAARLIGARAIVQVCSSPVRRAAQTAAPIAAALGLAVGLEPGVSEIDFGPWAGRSFAALANEPAWHAWNAFRSTACVPGGECMLAVQARAVAAIQRLCASWPEGEVVVVSHADVIKAILAHALGAPLDLLHRLQIDPGGMSRVAVEAQAWRVLDVNLR